MSSALVSLYVPPTLCRHKSHCTYIHMYFDIFISPSLQPTLLYATLNFPVLFDLRTDITDKFTGSKYDRVDEDNKYGATNQRRRDSRETPGDNKAWFVEM